MKNIFILFIVVLAFSGCTQNNNHKADTLVSEIDSLMSNGNYDLALSNMDQAIKLYSDNNLKESAILKRAEISEYILHHTNRKELMTKAVDDFGTIIEKSQNDSLKALAAHKRAEMYHNLRLYKKADTDYETAFTLYKDNNKKAFVYLEKAKALEDNNFPDSAKWHLEKALELAVDNELKAQIHHNLGSVLSILGEFDKAQNEFGIAINTYQNDEKRGMVYYDIALSYENADNSVKAIENYEIASKMCKEQENLSDIYNNLGALYFVEKKFDLAQSNFAKALENNDNNPRLMLNQALSYLYNDDIDNALSTIDKAIKIDERIAFIVSTSEEIRAYAMSLEEEKTTELQNRLNEILSQVKVDQNNAVEKNNSPEPK